MSRPVRGELPETGRLLAPAGSMECLEAALRAGADGVYFGGRGLNARRKAENFGPEEMKEAAALCREWGAESFLTLNTLLRDDELPEAFDLLEQAAEAGITGVIVQDMALPRRIKTFFPTLELHASTQMAVTSAAGLKTLEELGFDQAVLARECSASEIEKMIRETHMHIEVFCHGALCMGLSGQCYMSAMIGGRSGNRGLCAQPCRLDFSMPGFEKCLSLKDLCLAARLNEMRRMGIRTLKIEGRMKRPEYVMAAVSAYRAALDGREPDLDTLAAVFSRSGFTEGCFAGQIDRNMFGFRRKEDVCAAESGIFRSIRHQNEKEPAAVGVRGGFREESGRVSLCVTDGKRQAEAQAETQKSEQPVNIPETEEKIRRTVCSTGNTPYEFTELSCSLSGEAYLPDSLLRRLRREALEKLSGVRRAFEPPEPADRAGFLSPDRDDTPKTVSRSAAAVCREAEQALAMTGIRDFYLPLKEAEKFRRQAGTDCAVGVLLPPVFFSRPEEGLLYEIRQAGFDRVLAQSPGAAYAAAGMGFHVTAGPTLNLFSRQAELAWRALGADETIRSFESGLRDLDSCDAKSGVIIYGRLPLMVLRACPRKAQKGCAGCPKHYEIQDRTGRTFPVFCGGEAAVLHNADPLWLSDRTGLFRAPGRLFFWMTDESPRQAGEVLKAYETGARPEGSFTRGLYQRRREEHLAEDLREKRMEKQAAGAQRGKQFHQQRGNSHYGSQNQTAETGRRLPRKSHRGKRGL